jgi:UDP-2,3-diacylglucosamine hydrolase
VITLFISDLHLDGSRPKITEQFLKLLKTEARSASAVYILGDFFEAWIGDDDDDPHHATVMDALREFTQTSGVPVYLMHGNRDFLIGKRFARRTGVQLLDDPTVIDLNGSPTLLAHGDALCTDDVQYQKARVTIRSPLVKGIFLAMPLFMRRAYAAKLRRDSRAHTAGKADYIMDVNQGAVEDAMQKHGVTRMIHGHTHRPAIHRFKSADGRQMERIVLGDWYDQASELRWDESGGTLADVRVTDGNAD